jgi:tetratricopeptide (TPR) repeat protein
MTPEVRAETQNRAERALRRGELSEAVSLYETLCQAFPGDEALSSRLTLLREMLQPSELQSAPPSHPAPPPRPLGRSSAVAEGERLFAMGDYVGAASAYRRALQERPDNELIRERLEEIYRLAREMPSVQSPTDKALPKEPELRLNALLDRLAARRRLKRD